MSVPPGPPPPKPPRPPPPPQPYSSSPSGRGPAAEGRTNWWAIVALVFGVLGGILISVVCGIVGLKKADHYGSGRTTAVIGLVLAGVWTLVLIIGVGVYLALDRGGVDVAEVGVGECVAEVPDSSRVSTLHTVDCAEPHRGEVVAVIALPDGDHPGRPVLEDQLRQCGPALTDYAPAAAQDRTVELFVLAPSEESWDRGHRAVTCIAITDGPRTGSLR